MKRKPIVRKTIDYSCSVITHVKKRSANNKSINYLQPHADYAHRIEPMFALEQADRGNVSHAYLTKYFGTSYNKERSSVNCLHWTPNAHRLITGTHKGELTLWHGQNFSFETLFVAHEAPIRCAKWTPDEAFLVSSDDAGVIKYWRANMTPARTLPRRIFGGGSKLAVYGLTFSPLIGSLSPKFMACSDDRTIRLYDFETGAEERCLEGHQAEVRSVAWHPTMALVLSAGRDGDLKFWDARLGSHVSSTPNAAPLTKVTWNANGQWFLTASRDQLIRHYDCRRHDTPVAMYEGHKREVTCVEWHPQFESLFASGSVDGRVCYWIAGEGESEEKENKLPVAEICGAHDGAILTLAWHPLGHLLATGGLDYSYKVWTRNRPGDEMRDQYNVNQLPEPERKEAMLDLLHAVEVQNSVYPKLPVALEGFKDKLEEETIAEEEEQAFPDDCFD